MNNRKTKRLWMLEERYFKICTMRLEEKYQGMFFVIKMRNGKYKQCPVALVIIHVHEPTVILHILLHYNYIHTVHCTPLSFTCDELSSQ